MTSNAAKKPLVWAVLGAFAAIPGVLGMWGFTVDDALISTRVASNIAHGNGYRFNAAGPVVDAVTPLGWAYALAPFAEGGPWSALSAARGLGALAWLACSAILFRELAVVSKRTRILLLAVSAASLPLSAWAVSGMETPWITLLATLAVTQRRWAGLWAGLAAAWRPELLGWALTGSIIAGADRAEARVLGRVVWLVLMPSLVVGAVRLAAFGSPLPLALEAKPPDFAQGLRYAVGAACLCGPPMLLLFARTFKRLERRIWGWGLAFLLHLLSLVLAGGDWMSFYRLVVPALPGVLWVGAHLLDHVSWRAAVPRVALALGGPALLWSYQGRAARAVAAQRFELIESAREPLAGASMVGTVDVGWVGTATSANILDFAGVTNPRIAVLPGGHTSKRIPPAQLGEVDALVLLLDEGAELEQPWFTSRFYYAVDRTVAHGVRDLDFAPRALVPLPGSGRRYVVLRRR